LPAAEAWCEEQFGRAVPALEKEATPEPAAKKAKAAAAKGVICITGFRDAALQTKLEAAGYTVAGLSGKTTILLVKDAGENNNKVKEARERGIRIVARDEVEGLF
jgi:hypothetical protein